MAPVIEVKNLKKYFSVSAGQLHAVDDVSIAIERGRTLGVVGESGCGKSTLGRTIIHLQDATDGEIFLNGENITHLNAAGLKKARQKMQIIFQDPYSSLNPRMTIMDIIRDPLKVYGWRGKELDHQVALLMSRVGIEPRLASSYPHEL
ncbi:MAG: ATP-binding cassette domain-containing protein, partial [Lachnospiraceae bacterium]|nr:ATP-binding cassette domain-containing protein [Lachnospiraceae bacterium]